MEILSNLGQYVNDQEKPNNIDELWETSLKNIVANNYNESLKVNSRSYEVDNAHIMLTLPTWLPKADLYGKAVDIWSNPPDWMLDASPTVERKNYGVYYDNKKFLQDEEIREAFTEALDYRKSQKLVPVVAFGVAYDTCKNSEEAEKNGQDQEIKAILRDPQRRTDFIYILENYVHNETLTGRYDKIAGFLKDRKVGTDTEATLLDVGSSGGQPLEIFNQNNFPKLEVIAVDRMLPKVYERYFGTPENLNLKRELGDARDLKEEDNSVDAVILSYILFHLPETECKKVLSEALRVVKLGGLVFIQGLREGGEPNNDKPGNDKYDGLVLTKKDDNTLEETFAYQEK